ncbi:tRNA (N6-threonylcarbamoyladenosine(37)-N6)-methyltransferase TrmO [Colwellia sp. E2M01]|uniref:tRNA (N6-threonylcarbamoyladenosine(37)-N6)-methyltransferase TrmO n=1 Tax=Colwellia sp. E2M01 TaxID=2841561 RepID=UPI001C09C9B3|nr:tRNA (N6-threonylcarbamoyladenosine(37)-N6)-methyltransferase TrmO [Colwellia sp. E2M01]MBU2871658.1 tRNA (N6-threonylcarbamoyladenosine(37)-N6)-methyltransferase TrmO [Colwellia sp. E2M01]
MSNNTNHSFSFDTIATIESPYQEKFAIPRQPNLVSAAKGKVILIGDANNAELIRGIEEFSHLWLLFVFHGTKDQGWKPLVRPPRLGGNVKTGVLATRSTFRPNPIGMSVVKLDRVTTDNKQTILHISGLDLLNGTPIVDIKPYIPYSDAIIHANGGFAQAKPESNITVNFNIQAQADLAKHATLHTKNQQAECDLALLIEQVLKQDPRPAYKQGKVDDKVYAMSLYNLNIQWQFTSLTNIVVLSVTIIPSEMTGSDLENKIPSNKPLNSKANIT